MLKQLKTSAGLPEEGIGVLHVLEQDSELTYKVEIWVMRSGVNRNHWNYLNVPKYANTFLGQPILCAYVGNRIGDGHNMRQAIDPETGKPYYTFRDGDSERIVGAIGDRRGDVRVEKVQGEEWIVAKGKLWRFYNPELVDKIARQGRMEVSAETGVTEEHTENGITDIVQWEGIGVTILGDNVEPAIPGANIKALAAMRADFQALKLRAASFEGNAGGKNDKNEGVKATMSKTTIAALQKKFEGYRVLAASEDGMKVCLLDADGAPCTYTFSSKEDMGAVVPERIERVAVQAAFRFADETVLHVDAAELVENAQRAAAEAKAQADAAGQDLAAAKETLAKMEKAENGRRVETVKDTVKRVLAEFNANRAPEDRVSETLADEILTAADQGAYTALVDAEGAWVGLERAKADLSAKCMAAVTELDAKRRAAEEDKGKKTYVWMSDAAGGKHQESGGVEALIAEFSGK